MIVHEDGMATKVGCGPHLSCLQVHPVHHIDPLASKVTTITGIRAPAYHTMHEREIPGIIHQVHRVHHYANPLGQLRCHHQAGPSGGLHVHRHDCAGSGTVEAASKIYRGPEQLKAGVEQHPAVIAGLGDGQCPAPIGREVEADRAVVHETGRGKIPEVACDPRKLGHLACERVQQADNISSLGGLLARQEEEEEEEALCRGNLEHAVVAELRDVHLDALAGGGVEELAATRVWGVGGVERLVGAAEHDPLPGVEAGVVKDAATRARVSAASPPRGAHDPEADIARHVVGEDALGDQTRWPLVKIRPVPPSGAGEGGARALGAPG